jgi:hypothetical protein
MSTTRRELIKKAAFVTPLILTFPARASFAQAGSTSSQEPAKTHKDKWDEHEHKPKWDLRHN